MGYKRRRRRRQGWGIKGGSIGGEKGGLYSKRHSVCGWEKVVNRQEAAR